MKVIVYLICALVGVVMAKHATHDSFHHSFRNKSSPKVTAEKKSHKNVNFIQLPMDHDSGNTEGEHQQADSRLKNGYVDWDCSSRKMAQQECMAYQTTENFEDLNIFNAYAEDYARSVDEIQFASKCFYSKAPAFWDCVLDVFKGCVRQEKPIALDEYYSAYERFPKLPHALYDSQCFCKMTYFDVRAKNKLLNYAGADFIPAGNYTLLAKQIESYSDGYFDCVKNNFDKLEVETFNAPFDALNKLCLKLMDPKDKPNVKIYNSIVEEGNQCKTWPELYQKLYNNPTLDKLDALKCIKSNLPTVSKFQNAPFTNLNTCLDKLDLTSRDEILKLDTLIKNTANVKDWDNFKTEFEKEQLQNDSKSALFNCIKSKIPIKFASPFDIINSNCKVQLNSASEADIAAYNKFALNANNKFKSWDELKQEVKNENLEASKSSIFQCIVNQLPASVGQFGAPFQSLNGCVQKIDKKNKQLIQAYNAFVNKSYQLKNWPQLAGEFQSEKLDKSSEGVFQCIKGLIPTTLSFPKAFDVLNKNCVAAKLDTTDVKQIEASNEIIKKMQNDKDWLSFAKDFQPIYLKNQNDPYLKCIFQNIPVPQVEKFKPPFDIMNNCYYALQKNIIQITLLNSLVSGVSANNYWDEFLATFNSQDLNSKENQSLEIFQCIKQKIPIIEQFQTPYAVLNEKCVNPNLDKASRNDILQLDLLIDAIKVKKHNKLRTRSPMTDYKVFVTHKHAAASSKTTATTTTPNNNLAPTVYQENQGALNFTEINGSFQMTEDQQQWDQLINAMKQLGLSKSQIISNATAQKTISESNQKIFECIELNAFELILKFQQDSFSDMNTCLPDLDVASDLDIERIKNYHTVSAQDTSYNQLKKDYDAQGLSSLQIKIFECFESVIESMMSNKKAVGTGGTLYLLAVL